MQDFLEFKRFITPDVLIACYSCGAVLMPLLLWLTRGWLLRRLGLLETRKRLIERLGRRNRLLLTLAMIAVFLAMELAWRMMFETMIAYFQMRDYLQMLSTQAGFAPF